MQAEPRAAVLLEKRHDARQRRLVVVRIQAEAPGRDAPAQLDVRRLHDHKTGARDGQLPQVPQVPVGRAAGDRAVLAQRRNDDPG